MLPGSVQLIFSHDGLGLLSFLLQFYFLFYLFFILFFQDNMYRLAADYTA